MHWQKKISSILIFTFIFHILAPLSLVQAQGPRVVRRLRIPVSPSTIIETENGVTKLQVTDHQASTRLTLGPDGSLSEVTYSPYGEGGIDVQTHHLYTNHRKLEGLPVYHAGARFYSPTTGTFIQPDMVEGPVRYSYGHNNPITFTDPTGNSAYAGGGEGGSSIGNSLEMTITSLGGKSKMTSPASVGATALPWDDDTHYREVRCDAGCLAKSSLVIGSAVATGFGGAFLAAAQIGMTGVSAMSVMAPTAGGVSVATESSVGATAGSFALRSLAIKAAKDFAVGAVLSGAFEAVSEKIVDGKIDPVEVAKFAAVGGVSQALAWGVAGPEKVVSLFPRLGKTVLTPLRTIPAILVDGAIWSPITAAHYSDSSLSSLYGINVAQQGLMQGAIGAMNALGGLVHFNQAGTVFFMSVMGGMMSAERDQRIQTEVSDGIKIKNH